MSLAGDQILKTLKCKIIPRDWLKSRMLHEVKNNVIDKLEMLTTNIFDDDIYDTDRLTKNTSPKSLGTIENSEEWNAQFYWWNSESIANYYDGLMRYGFLLEDASIIKKVESFVTHILASQDDDGYIGIYDKDLRYNFNSENGELWSKATLYRMLLGYYFYTNKLEVLTSVLKATENVMTAYPINQSHPFSNENGFAGLAHGLMFTDILFSLYEITTEEKYLDYAVFLIDDYNLFTQSEEDIKYKNLDDKTYRFTGHGVHTYEHLRAIAIKAFKDKKSSHYITKYFEKLDNVLSPSGGPIGDEWIAKNIVDSSMHGYEFCSIHELMDSLLFISDLGLRNEFALAEKIFKNAHYGAKHHNHTIAYLKSDNSYEMTGKFQYDQPHSLHNIQTRYKYSPTHQDAAVCCVPNSVRITPYYIENAISIEESTVFINYIIPIEVTVKLNNKEYFLTIKQDSMYSDFTIETNLGNHLVDRSSHEFNIEVQQDKLGRYYFSRNNVVYAYNIEKTEQIIKDYAFDLHDLHILPQKPFEPLLLKNLNHQFIDEDVPKILVTSNIGEIYLEPIGETVLRQVTFKQSEQ